MSRMKSLPWAMAVATARAIVPTTTTTTTTSPPRSRTTPSTTTKAPSPATKTICSGPTRAAAEPTKRPPFLPSSTLDTPTAPLPSTIGALPNRPQSPHPLDASSPPLPALFTRTPPSPPLPRRRLPSRHRPANRPVACRNSPGPRSASRDSTRPPWGFIAPENTMPPWTLFAKRRDGGGSWSRLWRWSRGGSGSATSSELLPRRRRRRLARPMRRKWARRPRTPLSIRCAIDRSCSSSRTTRRSISSEREWLAHRTFTNVWISTRGCTPSRMSRPSKLPSSGPWVPVPRMRRKTT
mmetsp:Transcript_11505/g.22265  ORF Transcript_11505/g.22265 Transcript_11505/m.22265 type:complete len:295 (+) Transcript_11505:599-1483(+)